MHYIFLEYIAQNILQAQKQWMTKMASWAAETCRHELNKTCSYLLLWNIIVYRRK